MSEPDLGNRTNSNWPNYTPAAIDLGACAVFAFPLFIGVGTIGVLTAYGDNIGMLTHEQTADGRVLSGMLPALMASIQIGASVNSLAGELSDAAAHRAEVYQASGMTAVQLGIAVVDALVRIRAHAYAANETVAHVSQEILAHRLQLGDDR